ncbi:MULTISPECIES: hypothetical protein [Aphanizomenonaceae]|uniref:Uncharacterized protein n=1 Tax=Dolichospermum heterosporum TAC447 TaxID=747523 RepID=A0ABY5LXN8_9CYAN|nr:MULTISPECIES: hypothetical protein [Aphanizomenonaceae]MBE9257751.1 hypothetical protein [Dolichospermum sp. LEGE 00246]MDK2410212.1 hypothetical protein [Aphanizomenon sp. 202]MDK2458886.1 hypothetical protein [Aphanizomenon sp. PH219]UUO15420.1 hypothetical protein NG743_26110 [Dolichospermum heterosporum TAC447]
MTLKMRTTFFATLTAVALTSNIITPYQPWVQAQTVKPVPSPVPTYNPSPSVTPNPVEVTIPDGTEIILSTLDELSSKTARTGDLVNLRVDEDVIVEGKAVITAGTRARAEIAEAQKSGLFGRKGKLSLKILSTSAVDGTKISLLAGRNSEGGGNVGVSIAVFALVSPLGFFIKGQNAVIPVGTKIRAIIDGKTKISISQ